MQPDRIKNVYNEVRRRNKWKTRWETFSRYRKNKSVTVDLKNNKAGSAFDGQF